MKTGLLTCENCGAKLLDAEPGTTVECEVCHALTLVGAEPGMRDLITPELSGSIAGRFRKMGTARILVPVVLVVALVAIGLIFAVHQGRRRDAARELAALASLPVPTPSPTPIPTPAPTPPPEVGPKWVGGEHSPILFDVSGDGVSDVIGRVRTRDTYDSPVSLAAFDGESGKLLWRGPPLGLERDLRKERAGLAEATLLWASTSGSLRAFSARDAKPLWTVELPEWDPKLGPYEPRFCKAGAGQVKVRLTASRSAVLQLADGQVVAGARAERGCVRLAEDGKRGDPGYEIGSGRGIRVDGMESALAISRAEGPTVVLGSKRYASPSYPLIAAVFKDRSRNWQTPIAGTRADEAGSAPQVAALTATRVYTVYDRGHGVLVSFDLASGARQWETALPEHPGPSADAVQASDHRVLVSMSGLLQVFDAKSGKVRFEIAGK